MSIDTNEYWAPIQGYEGRYEISNAGNVKSLSKISGKAMRSPIILKRNQTKHGYLAVALYDTMGVAKVFQVHRLVATAFIPNPENKPFVLHKDNDGLNPHASNLEWGTQSENILHCVRSGRHRNGADKKRGKTGYLCKNSIPCELIGPLGESKPFGSMAEAARSLGVKTIDVSSIANRDNRTVRGFKVIKYNKAS